MIGCDDGGVCGVGVGGGGGDFEEGGDENDDKKDLKPAELQKNCDSRSS